MPDSVCPQCGSPIEANQAGGVCPKCFMGIGLAPPPVRPTEAHSGTFIPPKPTQLEQHFPQLEILDLIGQGGMGAVYRARQRGLDRLVALKILPPALSQDPSFAQRFEREARALAKLNHPNIVGVYDSGRSGDLYFFLMEYVDGVDLRGAIAAGEMRPQEALAIVPQICDALQYAHDEGVVHRDIKPENVLVDKSGRIKIADFGLARLLGRGGESHTLTGSQQVMGTPRYMAPEQMEGAREVDHRADIYSLGVVFYEMLTGELPLGRFQPPSRKVQVDVRVDDVVLRTLEKEPHLRYQHASEIRSAVDGIREFDQLPPHLSRMYGYEYRSKTMLFGLPLIHMTSGMDPDTGKRRVSKGVIAIGEVAIGGLALGGLSLGGITFGGCSFGVVSLGGISVGLLAALGGVALGLGVSSGGVAIGGVAAGGLALGAIAIGEAAAGLISHSSQNPNPNLKQVFQNALLPGIVAFWALVGFICIAASIVGSLARNRKLASEPRLSQPDPHVSAPVRSGWSWVPIVLLSCLMLSCMLGGLLLFAGSWLYTARRSKSAAAAVIEYQQPPESPSARPWEVAEDHVELRPDVRDGYNLTLDEVIRLEETLLKAHLAYVQLEKRHSRGSNTKGQQRTELRLPADDRSALQQELEQQLLEILGPERGPVFLDDVRASLRPRSGPAGPILVCGLLGFSEDETTITIWTSGEGRSYHWIIVNNRQQYGSSGSQLPTELARFWNPDQ